MHKEDGHCHAGEGRRLESCACDRDIKPAKQDNIPQGDDMAHLGGQQCSGWRHINSVGVHVGVADWMSDEGRRLRGSIDGRCCRRTPAQIQPVDTLNIEDTLASDIKLANVHHSHSPIVIGKDLSKGRLIWLVGVYTPVKGKLSSAIVGAPTLCEPQQAPACLVEWPL
jgi:hypothetical protein